MWLHWSDFEEVHFGDTKGGKKTGTVPLNREPAGGIRRIKKAKWEGLRYLWWTHHCGHTHCRHCPVRKHTRGSSERPWPSCPLDNRRSSLDVSHPPPRPPLPWALWEVRRQSCFSLSTAAFCRPRPRADRVHRVRDQASLHSHSGERWGGHGGCAASPQTRRVSAALLSLPSATGTAAVTSDGWAGASGAPQPITMRGKLEHVYGSPAGTRRRGAGYRWAGSNVRMTYFCLDSY